MKIIFAKTGRYLLAKALTRTSLETTSGRKVHTPSLRKFCVCSKRFRSLPRPLHSSLETPSKLAENRCPRSTAISNCLSSIHGSFEAHLNIRNHFLISSLQPKSSQRLNQQGTANDNRPSGCQKPRLKRQTLKLKLGSRPSNFWQKISEQVSLDCSSLSMRVRAALLGE